MGKAVKGALVAGAAAVAGAVVAAGTELGAAAEGSCVAAVAVADLVGAYQQGLG